MLETIPAGTTGTPAPIGAAAAFDTDARDGAVDGFALLLALLAAAPVPAQPGQTAGPGVATESVIASATAPGGVLLPDALAAAGTGSPGAASLADPRLVADALPSAAADGRVVGQLPGRSPASSPDALLRAGPPAAHEGHGSLGAEGGGMPDAAETASLADGGHPSVRPGRRSFVGSSQPGAPVGPVPMAGPAHDEGWNGAITAASPEAGSRSAEAPPASPTPDPQGRPATLSLAAAPPGVERRSGMQVVAEPPEPAPAAEEVQPQPAGSPARPRVPQARLVTGEAAARAASASPDTSTDPADTGAGPPDPPAIPDPAGTIESPSSPVRPGADPALARSSLTAPARPPAIQIAATILERAGAPVDRLRLRLEPAELGTVEITLTAEGRRKARAVLLVERPETLELLQREQRSLERILSATGLQLASGGLELGLRQGGNGRHGRSELPVADAALASDSPGERAPPARLLTLRLLDLVV